MSITEKFRKAEQKEADEKAAQWGGKELEGPTVKQILANDEQSRLFGMHLEEEGAHDLAAKLKLGELSPEELDELSAERQNFLKIMESVKSVRERLSSKNIEAIVKASPELQRIAGLVGAKGVQEAVLRDLERLAIQDAEHFRYISDAVEGADEIEASMKEEDKKVAKICAQYGIREDNYLKAVRSSDPNAVYDLIKENMGWWTKTFGSKVKIGMEVAKANRAGEIRDLSTEYDRRLREIAESLQATIIDNEGVNAALIRDLRGERPERPEKELTFSDLMKVQMDEEDAQFGWIEYERDHEKDLGFSTDQAKSDFSASYLEKKGLKKKNGFWGTVGANIMNSFLKGI